MTRGRPEASAFFAERKRWSLDKYAILGRYLETAARILKFLWVVDLFAGQGQFDSGEDGSPVLVARLADRAESAARAYKIRGIFVERDPQLFGNLERCLSAFDKGLYAAYQGPFSDHLPAILQQVGGRPALFFLDPFGVEPLRWESIAPIFRRAGRTELLVNFNAVHARRLAGFLASDAMYSEGWLQVLDGVMGDREWREVVQAERTGAARDDAICREYLKRLNGRGGFDFAEAYPVVDPDNESLKYFLVYATRHPRIRGFIGGRAKLGPGMR